MMEETKKTGPPHELPSLKGAKDVNVNVNLRTKASVSSTTPSCSSSTTSSSASTTKTGSGFLGSLMPADYNKVHETLDEYKCPICMDILVKTNVVSCGHRFCLQCIKQWFHHSFPRRFCPVCRKNCMYFQDDSTIDGIVSELFTCLPEQEQEERRAVLREREFLSGHLPSVNRPTADNQQSQQSSQQQQMYFDGFIDEITQWQNEFMTTSPFEYEPILTDQFFPTFQPLTYTVEQFPERTTSATVIYQNAAAFNDLQNSDESVNHHRNVGGNPSYLQAASDLLLANLEAQSPRATTAPADLIYNRDGWHHPSHHPPTMINNQAHQHHNHSQPHHHHHHHNHGHGHNHHHPLHHPQQHAQQPPKPPQPPPPHHGMNPFGSYFPDPFRNTRENLHHHSHNNNNNNNSNNTNNNQNDSSRFGSHHQNNSYNQSQNQNQSQNLHYASVMSEMTRRNNTINDNLTKNNNILQRANNGNNNYAHNIGESHGHPPPFNSINSTSMAFEYLDDNRIHGDGGFQNYPNLHNIMWSGHTNNNSNNNHSGRRPLLQDSRIKGHPPPPPPGELLESLGLLPDPNQNATPGNQPPTLPPIPNSKFSSYADHHRSFNNLGSEVSKSSQQQAQIQLQQPPPPPPLVDLLFPPSSANATADSIRINWSGAAAGPGKLDGPCQNNNSYNSNGNNSEWHIINGHQFDPWTTPANNNYHPFQTRAADYTFYHSQNHANFPNKSGANGVNAPNNVNANANANINANGRNVRGYGVNNNGNNNVASNKAVKKPSVVPKTHEDYQQEVLIQQEFQRLDQLLLRDDDPLDCHTSDAEGSDEPGPFLSAQHQTQNQNQSQSRRQNPSQNQTNPNTNNTSHIPSIKQTNPEAFRYLAAVTGSGNAGNGTNTSANTNISTTTATTMTAAATTSMPTGTLTPQGQAMPPPPPSTILPIPNKPQTINNSLTGVKTFSEVVSAHYNPQSGVSGNNNNVNSNNNSNATTTSATVATNKTPNVNGACTSSSQVEPEATLTSRVAAVVEEFRRNCEQITRHANQRVEEERKLHLITMQRTMIQPQGQGPNQGQAPATKESGQAQGSALATALNTGKMAAPLSQLSTTTPTNDSSNSAAAPPVMIVRPVEANKGNLEKPQPITTTKNPPPNSTSTSTVQQSQPQKGGDRINGHGETGHQAQNYSSSEQQTAAAQHPHQQQPRTYTGPLRFDELRTVDRSNIFQLPMTSTTQTAAQVQQEQQAVEQRQVVPRGKSQAQPPPSSQIPRIRLESSNHHQKQHRPNSVLSTSSANNNNSYLLDSPSESSSRCSTATPTQKLSTTNMMMGVSHGDGIWGNQPQMTARMYLPNGMLVFKLEYQPSSGSCSPSVQGGGLGGSLTHDLNANLLNTSSSVSSSLSSSSTSSTSANPGDILAKFTHPVIHILPLSSDGSTRLNLAFDVLYQGSSGFAS